MATLSTDAPIFPLPQRMQHDMLMRGVGSHTQQGYVRHVRRFAVSLAARLQSGGIWTLGKRFDLTVLVEQRQPGEKSIVTRNDPVLRPGDPHHGCCRSRQTGAGAGGTGGRTVTCPPSLGGFRQSRRHGKASQLPTTT